MYVIAGEPVGLSPFVHYYLVLSVFDVPWMCIYCFAGCFEFEHLFPEFLRDISRGEAAIN